ncbi:MULTISPECIES: STAS domain-containing protein [unclassified Streptomyces]|uniref:STAS domain-containing protein n=1 Tax=unclassified Streptomyces TaxID=2593676 RepID=UPI0004BE7F7E|nr:MULTISPECIES: STAS domain-containing protein [unclassified Streptomyces]KOV93052.1 anti-anti-sigma regulatory factor [Streptomyces sp. NRRL B-3648]
MTTPLTLVPERGPDGSARLAVRGEIDMSNAGSLDEALAAESGPVVVDLTEVEYLDSAGLSVLFAHADRLELIATPLLEPVLTVSGLVGLATVHGLGREP